MCVKTQKAHAKGPLYHYSGIISKKYSFDTLKVLPRSVIKKYPHDFPKMIVIGYSLR